MTLVVIPNVDAETFDELEERARLTINTHEEYFEAFSNWASDNKDILGKDISFYVENKGTTKADFTVSNISIIPDERVNHVLSFDTTVKLKSELRYPHEFVLDGRDLTVRSHILDEEYGYVFDNPLCEFTGAEFNPESGDTGTFHSCFGIGGHIDELNRVDWDEQGVAIYMDYYNTGLQPISVFYMADIENTGEKTISGAQEIWWLDGIINFFKSLFG